MSDPGLMKVTGLKELGFALGKFPDEIERKWVRKAFKKGAKIAKAEMERRARRSAKGPSHSEVGTHLADNIKITARLSKKKAAIIKVGPDGNHWWGGFQEFGTPHVAADPFMRPALDHNKTEIIAVAIGVLRTGVKVEAAKLPKGK